MFKLLKLSAFALAAAYLAACGGSSSQTGADEYVDESGDVVRDPAFPHRVAERRRLSRHELAGTRPAAHSCCEITGNPVCGVDFYYIKFWTVGGAGETTESSGALMVPTGAAPACSGPRPIVLYAHGTNTEQGAEHRRHHQHREHRGRADRRHVRRAGLHRGGAELRRLRHLDAWLSSVPERRPAVGRDDGHPRRRAHRAAEHHVARPPATTASCSSPAIPRAATSRWRRCARCKRRARP